MNLAIAISRRKKTIKIPINFIIKLFSLIIVFISASSVVYSQYFTFVGNLQADGIDIEVGGWSSPEFADIDCDGDSDLYVGNSGGDINVFINNGTGVFSNYGLLQADGSNISEVSFSSPEFADIDQDGDQDLFVGYDTSEFVPFTEDWHHGYINVYSNDGTGSFSAQGRLQADGIDIDVHGYAAPVFADIDNDNDLDMYVGEGSYQKGGGKIQVFINDGDGNFSQAGYLQADGTDIYCAMGTPEFADIDNDNDLDLYVGEGLGNINVFINDGDGNFSQAGYLQADGNDIDVGSSSTPEFADIDQDGDLDLYIGNGGGLIKVFRGVYMAHFIVQDDAGIVDSMFCTNEDINFTSTSTGISASYSWDFGEGASPPTASTQGPHTVQYTTGGLKTISLEVNDGVNSEIYYEEILIAEAIDDIQEISGAQHVVLGSTETYSVPAQDNTYFEWTLRSPFWTGESITNTINVTFVAYGFPGTIEVYPYNGCGVGSGASIYVDFEVSVDDLEGYFKIYPNPSTGIFNIRMQSGNNKEIELNVINPFGTILRTERVQVHKMTNKLLDLSEFSSGVYLLNIKGDKVNINRKLIIQKYK